MDMARNVSAVETHPQRQKIIDALVSGQMLKDIAAWASPPISTAAICRFRMKSLAFTRDALASVSSTIANNVATPDEATVAAVSKAALAIAVDPFAQRALEMDRERARIKALAEADGKLAIWSTLDRTDLAAQEYQARLAGRLDNVTHLQVAVVIPSAPGNQPVTIEDVITLDIKPSR